MGIVALYQAFGSDLKPCIKAAARLKDMQNMMPSCGDYFVMHSWRVGNIGDEHCVGVWRMYGEITVHFWANWAPMNGWFKAFQFPMNHEIWIGVRPNHGVGSREYNSFTWWVWDKTTDEYAEETRDTPETWTAKNMDVALEMVDTNTPNGLKRGMAELVCLDQNNNEVYLPDVFSWCEWPHPTTTNHREEVYTANGYEVECTQWKTSDAGIWKRLKTDSGTGWKKIYREAGTGWKALEYKV